MATTTRYVKPSLAGMPKDIDERILKTIRETPPFDYESSQREADEWERKVLAERERRKNNGD